MTENNDLMWCPDCQEWQAFTEYTSDVSDDPEVGLACEVCGWMDAETSERLQDGWLRNGLRGGLLHKKGRYV